jgi:hypothetical protein
MTFVMMKVNKRSLVILTKQIPNFLSLILSLWEEKRLKSVSLCTNKTLKFLKLPWTQSWAQFLNRISSVQKQILFMKVILMYKVSGTLEKFALVLQTFWRSWCIKLANFHHIKVIYFKRNILPRPTKLHKIGEKIPFDPSSFF